MTSTPTSSTQEFDLQKSYEFLNAALSSFSVFFDSSHVPLSQKYQRELATLLRSDSSGDSLVTRLLNQNPDMVQTIASLTGHKTFFQNLLRFTTRQTRQNIVDALNSFASAAATKAESVFNRNIVTLGEQGFDSRLPFPIFFLTQAKLALKLRQEVESIFYDFEFLAVPQSSYLDENISDSANRFCSELGFTQVDSGFLTLDDDLRCFRKLGIALETFFCGVLDSLYKIEFSCLSSPKFREVYTLADRLRAGANSFLSDHTRLSRNHLHGFEDKRSMLSSLMFDLQRSLTQLSEIYESGVVPDPLAMTSEESPVFLSSDVMNLLILDATSQGHSPQESTMAISKLFSYCSLHGTSPSKIIGAELKKIHPILNERILIKLSALSKPDPISGFVGSKRTRDLLFKELGGLKVKLGKLVPSALMILLIIGSLSMVGIQACAVKTNVQSSNGGLRPSIFEPVSKSDSGQKTPKTDETLDPKKKLSGATSP